jgi:hypothetical protein
MALQSSKINVTKDNYRDTYEASLTDFYLHINIKITFDTRNDYFILLEK